ncbi:MAG: hypothetical protein OEN02_05460 [Gammaproteobacteria bacterium]|nr:hypothetical protein [Gammaproteobacteria bacterium]MDH3534213.1 hypothetical protein [Gammaproteobacteria bacterium]
MIFDEEQQAELKKYTYSVYILQAISFVLLITSIIGVIINYIKDDDVRGSWLESHFRWQKATFWYGLLWTALGVLTTPIVIGYVVLGVVTIWLIYRIARGWIYLVDGKEMYLESMGDDNEQ